MKWTLSRQDIERAKEILRGNTPENSADGDLKTLTLSEKDLNVAADYLLNRYVDSASQVKVIGDQLDFSTSIAPPVNPAGVYLNVRFVLQTQGDKPQIKWLRLGAVEIPEKYAGSLLQAIIRISPFKKYYVLAGKHVKSINFAENGIRIAYNWNAKAFSKARKFFTADVDEDLLLVYQQELAQLTHGKVLDRRISLLTLLQPLFDVAHRRSEEGDPVAENHALLLVVGSYLNHQSIAPILPGRKAPQPAANKSVRLHSREDMARHFINSAALTATGNEKFADIIGMTKELEDAQDGSGFSFIDLAADRAGMRFGKMAVASKSDALKLQRIMRYATSERVFMPEVKDLPENIGNEEFKSTYGQGDHPLYLRMVEQIDRRIEDCLLYRNG